MRTRGRVYQVEVHLILPYGCEMWPVLDDNKRILAVFDNDCIRRILHGRSRGTNYGTAVPPSSAMDAGTVRLREVALIW